MAVKEFARFLYLAAGKKGKWLFLGAALTGVMQALILMELMYAVGEFVSNGSVPPFSYFFFTAALAVYYLSYRRSTTIGLDVAQRFIAESRKAIANGIAAAEYQGFTKIRRTDIYGALSANAALITEAARFMPNCLAASVLLFFAMLYAAAVSGAGAIVMAMMFAAVVLAFKFMESQNREFRNSYGAAEQKFMGGLEDLFNGFVELKMNQEKRDVFLKTKLLDYSDQADFHRRAYESVNMNGNALYAILNYLPSGVIAFVLPHFIEMSSADMLRLIGVSMFATPALVNLAMFEPLTGKSMETINGIKSVLSDLDAIRDDETGRQTPPENFDRIVVSDLSFAYETEQADGSRAEFVLRADHFTLNRGEILFLYGGNGNGKSTFCRLFAGLLTPQKGYLLVDDQILDREDMFNYRGLFSVIFSDFHLFDSLLASPDAFDVHEARRVIEMMELSDKVKVTSDGRFSTIDLSTGQRKRLALACAILEKRKILLLDEVAADFDPEFRATFYCRILPQLKRDGFTILAISHDDTYLDKADRKVRVTENRCVESDIQGLSSQ